MTRALDITGDRYGRLVALNLVSVVKGKTVWRFACDCGSRVDLPHNHVRGGRTNSCGCLRAEGHANRQHSKTGTPEYRTWTNMLTRCGNPKSVDYPNYGGRGITVCDRWKSFVNFYADMGERPEGTSIDRIDVNDGYHLENCRWATAVEQRANRRDSRRAA